MRILNQSKGTVLAQEARVADTFITRLKGLMGTKSLPQGQALILKPCNSVHMFFMRYPLDVLFLDKRRCVVACIAGLKPWHASTVHWRSRLAVELPAGMLAATQTAAGDTLVFEGCA